MRLRRTSSTLILITLCVFLPACSDHHDSRVRAAGNVAHFAGAVGCGILTWGMLDCGLFARPLVEAIAEGVVKHLDEDERPSFNNAVQQALDRDRDLTWKSPKRSSVSVDIKPEQTVRPQVVDVYAPSTPPKEPTNSAPVSAPVSAPKSDPKPRATQEKKQAAIVKNCKTAKILKNRQRRLEESENMSIDKNPRKQTTVYYAFMH